jgi:hypothetical protein
MENSGFQHHVNKRAGSEDKDAGFIEKSVRRFPA